MSNLSLRLPESLHQAARELAKKEKVSINQLIMLAVAEKIASIETFDYIKQRGKRGSKAKFHNILKSAPDVKPNKADEL